MTSHCGDNTSRRSLPTGNPSPGASAVVCPPNAACTFSQCATTRQVHELPAAYNAEKRNNMSDWRHVFVLHDLWGALLTYPPRTHMGERTDL